MKGLEEVFAIERKTISDIVGTRHEIEAGQYRSLSNPRAILASLAALEARYDIPVIFAPETLSAALMIEQWAFWSWREHSKAFTKPTPTPEWAV
ncbi:MAG: hypothetical protein QNL68_07635 [Akkermansiaceae bacterium]